GGDARQSAGDGGTRGAKNRLWPQDDAGANGERREAVGERLEVRRDFDWLSRAGGAGPSFARTVQFGQGWVGFHFSHAFGHPVKLVNDAAMQALGSYHGGRMLFLGLGTGLGSAMIVDGTLQPLELAHLPYKKGRTYEDYLGLRGLKRFGKKKWRRHVADVVERLKTALEPDYIVIGGGNLKKLKKLPSGAEPGDNRNAFRGGFRLWKGEDAKAAIHAPKASARNTQ